MSGENSFWDSPFLWVEISFNNLNHLGCLNLKYLNISTNRELLQIDQTIENQERGILKGNCSKIFKFINSLLKKRALWNSYLLQRFLNFMMIKRNLNNVLLTLTRQKYYILNIVSLFNKNL